MNQSMIDIPMRHQRDIKTVTAEIRTLTAAAQRLVLEYAIEIGRRLYEAKSMLPHGQWGQYLKEEVEFSQSTANNFMKIFDEYGADQLTLDGAVAKSQTLGNLSYTKALKLLAVPEEERESFVREHDVEHLSSRELERVIRERDEALRRAEQAEREAADAAVQQAHWEAERSTYAADLDQLAARAEAAEAAARTAQEAKAKAQKELDAMGTKLTQADKATEAAKEKLQETQEKLKKLQEAPEVPQALVDKLRSEAAATEKENFAQERSRLEQQLRAAEEEHKAAVTKAEALRKQLALASPETAVFKTLFETVQEDFNRLHGALLKADGVDPEQAQKLRTAVHALLESFRTRIG
ncbi:MAG: DUF3102 domain-containing protein [Oscillospiraceae bacterium]|nr:DUF3102 domain-containing protein [Oscillospiraceae bacterium]